MKKLLLLFGACLAFFMLQAQNQTFVYSKNGEQILFERNDTIQYVHFVPDAGTRDLQNVLDDLGALTSHIDMLTTEIYRCDLTGKSIANFINYIEEGDLIASFSSEYHLPGSNTLRWVTNNMYVKVKDGYSIEGSMQMAGISYLFAEPVGSLPNTFFVSIDNEDIFSASQLLFETGNVVYAEPSFYFLQFAKEEGGATAPSSLPKDWNLKGNVGATIGINALNAWNITTGNPNIKTAILDDGIHLDHTALTANLLPGVTFAAYTQNTPNGAAGYWDINGTPASGIIASTNPTQANYGIVKNSKIVPVKIRERTIIPNGSNPLTYAYLSYTDDIVKGLRWAMNNDVDVVNFSWSFEEIHPDFSGHPFDINIIEAMLETLSTFGREGKGIVVVSNSGDKNRNDVFAPASFLLDNVIAVGATTPGGYRVNRTDWGSNYGNRLDVVAPGENITTTKNNSYTNDYERTSAAAAHVSGVAALILSVNPNLTAKQVKDIIELTANRVHAGSGSNQYNYQTHSGRPNGLWHSEMGYGIVDAYAAVLKVLEGSCYNPNSGMPIVHGTISQNTTWSNPVFANLPVMVASGATLTVSSTVQCAPGVSFTVQPGGKLIINGGTFTNSCPNQTWGGITVNSGIVEIKSNGKVENAANGILAENGGVITLEHARFSSIPVTVQSGATLTLANSKQLQLQENSKITIEADGNFVIESGATIAGFNNNIANAIHVKGGEFTLGVTINFHNLSGGILLENSENTIDPSFYDKFKEYDLNYTTFNNTPLVHRGSKLNIENCSFNQGSHVVTSISNSVIDKCYFSNSTFSSNHSSLAAGYDGSIPVRTTVSNTQFTGNNSQTALSINNAKIFALEKNTIRSYETGISLTLSGRTLVEKEGSGGEVHPNYKGALITGNKVNLCGTGVELYSSIAQFKGNSISGGNGFGVRLYNNSYTSFGADVVQNLSENQYLISCNSYEFYASANSFPTLFRYNSIYNEDRLGNFKNAPYFWWDVTTPYTGAAKDLNYNCWGKHFNPTIHLHPANAFITDSIWCPILPIKQRGDDEILYLAGLDFFAEEDYTNAELTFKEIIETYPESHFAIAALHELFALEHYTNQDFFNLNTYFASFTDEESVLFNTAEFLATRCYVKEREWQPAVDWYEDRIMNPPSYQDSVFAVIDLGYIHLMMEADTMGGAKSGSVRYRLEEIKPKTKQHYEENKTALLATLPQIKKPQTDKPEIDKLEQEKITPSLPHSFNPSLPQKGILVSSIPNPTTGTTTISYELYTEGTVEIFIYNSVGQLVVQIPQGTQAEGTYQATVALTNMPKGIYHYAFYINGARVDTKKLIINH